MRARFGATIAVFCLAAALMTWLGPTPLFGWGTLPPAVSIAGMAMWWALFLYQFRFIIVTIDSWIVTLGYFGGRAPVLSTIRLVARSRIAATRLGLITVALVVAIGALYRIPFVVPFLLVLPWKMLAGLSDALQPPTMLVLANSNEKALWLQERLSGELVPHRVVSLLRLTTNDEWSKRNTGADIVRTRGDEDWMFVVTRLMQITPLVLFDARVETDFLRDEVSIVRMLGLEHKTLFIVAGGLPAPLIERRLAESHIAWAHDWSASGFLWYVTHYRRVRTTRDLPLSRLYRDFTDHVAMAGGHGTEDLRYLESVLDRVRV